VGPVQEDFVREREAFRATLDQLGPDAPTACGSWTTADVAVHVVTGEVAGALPNAPFRLLVGWGVRLDWMAPVNMWAFRRYRRRHGFDWAMRRLGHDPPRLQRHRAVAPVSLLEVWAHHDDVLAANDVGSCDSGVDLGPVLRVLTRYQRRFLHGVRVTSGEAVWCEPAKEVTVEVGGRAADLARWLAGRAGMEALAVCGEPAGIERLKALKLRL
jgi:uncharacterized protein (TIGR03083 family)